MYRITIDIEANERDYEAIVQALETIFGLLPEHTFIRSEKIE